MVDAAAPRSPNARRYQWVVALFIAIILPLLYNFVDFPILTRVGHDIDMSTAAMGSTSSASKASTRLPTYFLGIGGPNFMEAKNHPAFLKLGETGREITTKVKPKAVVVFSAHWQHGPTTLAINVAEKTDLIYDFYGFPPHYYEYKFPSKGSPQLAEVVISKLAKAGIEVNRVKRGLDHGVWVGFLAG